MLYDTIPYDMIWDHSIWYDMIVYQIIAYYMIWYDITSWYHNIDIIYMIWYYMIWYHIVPHHIIWYHITSYDMVMLRYHGMSCRMPPYRHPSSLWPRDAQNRRITYVFRAMRVDFDDFYCGPHETHNVDPESDFFRKQVVLAISQVIWYDIL